jgi:hypothetical protein
LFERRMQAANGLGDPIRHPEPVKFLHVPSVVGWSEGVCAKESSNSSPSV